MLLCQVFRHRTDLKTRARLLAIAAIFALLVSTLFTDDAISRESPIFRQFTQHIGKQIRKDKEAFSRASSCLSWFYKKAKQAPLPSVQGISWHLTASSEPGSNCLRAYPGGMDEARDDFSKTQSILSVSLTFYEFALVADRNDDAVYSPTELQDLFHGLSLPYRQGDPIPKQVTALTEQFDSWYRSRNMDALMQGMSDLYERGYRVTPSDRVALDRVMG